MGFGFGDMKRLRSWVLCKKICGPWFSLIEGMDGNGWIMTRVCSRLSRLEMFWSAEPIIAVIM
ncbi:hypothetical protein Hanom_Chr12g01164781 [Helianthus anomalus]